MEGLIFDIKRFAVHDGPGIRTTVFFKGCPLSCRWCHNPESRNAHLEEYEKTTVLEGRKFCHLEQIGYKITVQDLMNEIVKDKPFFDESSGGITLSGGEPLLQSEFLVEVLKACKKNHIHTSLDTSGFANSSVIDRVMPFVDLFLFDIKHTDSTAHKKLTGVENDLIIANLRSIAAGGSKVVIRYPLVPGFNDDDANLNALRSMMTGIDGLDELHIFPYHKTGDSKYDRFQLDTEKQNYREPSEESLRHVKEFFEEKKINVKIGG